MKGNLLSKRFFSSIIPLHDRVVLKVSGVDTKKFLQGLCTNDLNLLKNKGDSLVASFLNSKGRIFANTFIYAENENDVLLDAHSALAADLKRHLMLYKLRSKVSIASTDYQVQFSTNVNGSSDDENNALVKVVDPRITELGTRTIKAGEKLPIDKNTAEWMVTFDLLHGLAEGPEIVNRIPLECNLDLLRYISFSKGCYIGQELTARTRYKGLVRKRLVPFLLAESLENNVTNNTTAFDTLHPSLMEKILSETKEGKVYGATFSSPKVEKGDKVYKTLQENPVGEIIHTNSIGTLGLAMINLDAIHSHAGNFTVRQAPSEEEEGTTAQLSNASSTNAPTKFISTFRPSWFHGLDEKTNLKLNE